MGLQTATVWLGCASACGLVVAGCRLGFEQAAVDAHVDSADARDHCVGVRLVPSNGVTCDLLTGATASVTGTSLAFDSDTGEITDGATIVRPAGTGSLAGIGFYAVDEMGVFTAEAYDVPAAAVWAARGSNALVLYAATTIRVTGSIDGGATDQAGGPHGTAGGAGGARSSCEGQNGPYKFSIAAGAGGGGGGGATAGGSGAATAADGSGATSGGPGGIACPQPSTIPLRGGQGGGPGGTENLVVMGGPGGGGGGALALVAMTRVTIEGAIAAPGAGGVTNAGGSGGGGGGGGGALLVESIDVAIQGAATANGGGGGPATNAASNGARGQRGHTLDAMPAQGGANAGNGGAGTVAPTSGQTASGGGGGGGAVGTIEIRAVTSSLGTATFSPAPRVTAAIVN